jgi:hypothetical protein
MAVRALTKLNVVTTALAAVLTLFCAQQSSASVIETLVMPGKLIEGHADTESTCSACHEKFERRNQRTLCLDCHEDLADDIKLEKGFHSLFKDAKENTCSKCHTDHEGRDAVIIVFDKDTFDHKFTDFLLEEKHLEVECEDCHEAGLKYREAINECNGCHEDDNPHEETMGSECKDCHNAADWADVEYDHSTTGYELIGKHLETACLDCHEDQTYLGAPDTCYGCHEDDDSHNGRSGKECDDCHSPVSWDDTSFDHNRDTDFLLEGSHDELKCGDCHSEKPFDDELEPTCISCHLEDDEHKGHFGEDCDGCHAPSKWEESAFDHGRDADYTLNGAHSEITCEDCHVQPIFEVELLSGCNDCHADDDTHEGEQGTECGDCHNESTWDEDVFFDHDFTSFPLLGAHANEECDACHESNVFRDAPEACVDCHKADDPHRGRFFDDCAACHNPVEWEQWQFDHDTRTDFVLDGAHIDVECNACHRQTLEVLSRTGNRCGDCHRADDIHDGEFGFDCARCHTADSFENVEPR